jgi:hypothetical protein
MSTEYTLDVSMVSSVWSAHGHRFMSTDDDNDHSCLRCGAMYRLLADATDPTYGYYVTNAGDEPAQCTGDTSMVHGYPGERVCTVNGGRGCEDGCKHCEHDCPCILCDS